MHKLSEKNLEEGTAVCQICGPTRIVKIKQGGACPTGHAESNTRHYGINDGSVVKLNGKDRLKMIEDFGTDCMICGVDTEGLPQLDHCHETGEWRGVLCRSCNTGLGLFKDSQAMLIKAALYLQNSVAEPREIKVK